MSFPLILDNFPTNRIVGGPDPVGDNNTQAAATNALELKVGVNNSGDTSSLDYKVTQLQNNVHTYFQSKMDAWVFPDNTVDPTSAITNGSFYAIKPIWYQVESSGLLTLRNNSSFGAHFYYTTANVDLIRAHSTEQYINVSCGAAASMNALCSSSGNRATAVTTLTNFCTTNGFTGVEIDFEDFGSWTSGQYANYKTFVTQLGTALHSAGFKLILDFPPIWNSAVSTTSNEWTARNSTGYYQLKYQDFEALPVDYILPMAYDYQFDEGAGTPNSPLQWSADVLSWAQLKITDHSRIIMGLPTAGYSGATGGFVIVGSNYSIMSVITGFGTIVRDLSSGEIIFANAGTSYAAMDDTSIDLKVRFVEKFSCYRTSFWFAGGGNKFGTGATVRVLPT